MVIFMPRGWILFLTGLVLAVMSLTAAAAGKRPSEQWSYFHFDGHAFVAGEPSDDTPAVAVRAGVRPVLRGKGEGLPAVKLEAGAGALVGICYQQNSGGKLKPGPAFFPRAQVPVRIFSGDRLVRTAETDARGFFLVTLPAGSYRVEAREPVEVSVENGTTTLIPLRVGKRMAD